MINLSKKICKVSFFSCLVIFIASIFFKLILCSSLAVKNGDLETAFLAKKALEKEVSKLSFENSRLSRMEYIEEKAKQLGFVEMQDNLLLLDPNAPDQVAVLPQQ